MTEAGGDPHTQPDAADDGRSTMRLRRSGLVGLGVAIAASGALMVAAFALAIAPSAYYGGGGGGGGGGGSTPPSVSAAVSDNGTVTCVGDGFRHGSDATCSIASTPTLLGHMTANASGHVQGTFALPGDITAGTHTVTINGIGPNGNALSISVTVTVSAAAAAAAAAAAEAGVAGTVTASPQLTG